MDENTILRFVQKAISNTKRHLLGWSKMDGQQSLLRERPKKIEDALNSATISDFPANNLINYTDSFYACFRSGYIFLLLVSNDAFQKTSYSTVDPMDTIAHSISLRIQDSGSPYAKEIANSSISSEISVQLKRLYNLAEDSALNLEGFINDFLNS